MMEEVVVEAEGAEAMRENQLRDPCRLRAPRQHLKLTEQELDRMNQTGLMDQTGQMDQMHQAELLCFVRNGQQTWQEPRNDHDHRH